MDYRLGEEHLLRQLKDEVLWVPCPIDVEVVVGSSLLLKHRQGLLSSLASVGKRMSFKAATGNEMFLLLIHQLKTKNQTSKH